jgi:hypothetical protein
VNAFLHFAAKITSPNTLKRDQFYQEESSIRDVAFYIYAFIR